MKKTNGVWATSVLLTIMAVGCGLWPGMGRKWEPTPAKLTVENLTGSYAICDVRVKQHTVDKSYEKWTDNLLSDAKKIESGQRHVFDVFEGGVAVRVIDCQTRLVFQGPNLWVSGKKPNYLLFGGRGGVSYAHEI